MTHYRVGDGIAPPLAAQVIAPRLVSNYTHVTFQHVANLSETDLARSVVKTTTVTLGYDEASRSSDANAGRHPEVRIYDHALALADLSATTPSTGQYLSISWSILWRFNVHWLWLARSTKGSVLWSRS